MTWVRLRVWARRASRVSLGLFAAAGACPAASGQTRVAGPNAAAGPSGQAVGPDQALARALRDDPVTGPYLFRVAPGPQRGQYVLSGRVGTKLVHDAAIRTAIALGVPVRDDLVIDTAAAYRAASARPDGAWRGWSSFPASYVYPPPLMGRIDEPFYGFEPPLVSYPPGWGAVMSTREPLKLAAFQPAGPPPAFAPAGPPVSADALPPTVDLELDPLGVAVLRGKVPSLSDRMAVGQAVAKASGVTQVINLLDVDPTMDAAAKSDVPPPPPVPAVPRGRAAPPVIRNAAPPAAGAPVGAGDALSGRVAEALARRPQLAGLPVRVTTREGVATLTGRVPSAYEAMLAFRAAEQSPGVVGVVDRLEFDPPEVDGPNPLRDKGRPEDVAAYLLSHARRQLGDLAHVDRVEVRGDTLSVHGSVARDDDRARAEAALRSISLLRGFRVEPTFVVE